MAISETQLALLTILATGVIGARRGWGREIITCAIVLSTLVFLQIGGAGFVTNLLANGLASGAGTTADGAANCGANGQASFMGTAGASKAISEVIFGVMVWLGYFAGGRHGAPAQTLSHRLLGIVPGVITGGAISYYLSSVLYPGAGIFLQWLGAIGFLASLPLLLTIGLGGAALFLILSWQTGKSGKSGKG